MNLRLEALRSVGKKGERLSEAKGIKHSAQFQSHVFHEKIMEEMVPKKAFSLWKEGKQLGAEEFDQIAEAMKNWAIQKGATHYTHWFQPLTGAPAQKHDAFLSWGKDGRLIEEFRGKELMRGEPDASSFPSGGLRSTHEARGITVWDVASPPFLWEGGEGLTLCIPSLYFSWKGEALDYKIPLLRSDAKLEKKVLRLMKFCKMQGSRVYSTLGPEQEYFAIDRHLFLQRPDLMFAGRTVYGAKPPKGQELEDHYFGSLKDRVHAYMADFEEAALRLGIPVKTRHNEVAPAQHEVAPIFEKACLAADHNILLMDLMRHIGPKHELAPLFHEKPFAGINGSGKHCNWSLSTDTGLNLLDPKGKHLSFLILLTAIIHAVHEHAGLLRASIATGGNDHRLGGSEAPPTIISVYLGTALQHIVEEILSDKKGEKEKIRLIDLGLDHIPHHEADLSDRNRTSFFAFTGNKFEFRAVGASAHPAFPATVINAIVADSLELLLDELERIDPAEDLMSAVLPVLRKTLQKSKPILFEGNAYSSEWEREAETRGLLNIRRGFDALSQLKEKKALRAFAEILSPREVESRFEILVEQYVKGVQIEINLMIELFRTQILPAAYLDLKNRAEALERLEKLSIPHEKEGLAAFSELVERSIHAIDALEKVQRQTEDLGWEAKGKVLSDIGSVKMKEARSLVDALEKIVDNSLWPLPKYRELLFLV